MALEGELVGFIGCILDLFERVRQRFVTNFSWMDRRSFEYVESRVFYPDWKF